MSLEPEWRIAIQRIAKRNSKPIHDIVMAHRTQIRNALRFVCSEPPLPLEDVGNRHSESSEELLARHDTEDLTKLQDYIVFLIWDKLRQSCGRRQVDLFLGVSDLRDYLSRRHYYSQADVGAFIDSQGPPTQVGDLRRWLTLPIQKKDGTGTRPPRYPPREFDLFLLGEDLRKIRDEAPMATDGLDDWEIAESFMSRDPHARTAKMPKRILGWALTLGEALAAGYCICERSFVGRARTQACPRCDATHFISEPNIEAAKKKTGLKADYSDPLKFVERAVTGACRVPYARGSAQSMFATVFEAPDGARLSLAHIANDAGKKVYALTLQGYHAAGCIGDDERRQKPNVCIRCPEPDCRCYIGPPDTWKRCLDGKHVWEVGEVALDELDDDYRDKVDVVNTYTVDVYWCNTCHFCWPPYDQQCPICPDDSGVQGERSSIKVIYPVGLPRDQVRWPTA